MNDIIINLKNISKSFEDNKVLDDLSLEIKKDEFLTLLGPSGCGKTTTLKILAGFEFADSGQVLFNNKDITSLPPYKRELNTVFQKYALFPHLNVFDNIAFGLKLKKVSKKEIEIKVKDVLKLVSLIGYEKRDIESLSGGQQQRVAIARALVNEPKVLLLDEPLSALDSKLRKEMQLELKKMQKTLGITFIFVTHDQEEALTMSDTIIVMNKGKIQQMGSPEDIYNEPSNRFVAEFIGNSNIVDGIMLKDFKVEFCATTFECVDSGFIPNENIEVVIRPEDIEMCDLASSQLQATVKSTIFKGVHYEITVQNQHLNWIIHSTKSATVGDTIGLCLAPESIHIMKKEEKIDE
ncbi:MAG: spermidine/putrescine ABC transporter ATP-binding protein [Sarcina sp.]